MHHGTGGDFPEPIAKDYLMKSRNPDLHYDGDLYIAPALLPLLDSVVARLRRLRNYVGHGNFSLLGYDEALYYGKKQPVVGVFTDNEQRFLENVFMVDAKRYGFMGAKPVTDLHRRVDRATIRRVHGSGNYLFIGASLEKFEKVKADIGELLILTSGVRNLAKQFYLFLAKAAAHRGNLSLASRSLAPPGYSYHATGDFDVGQKGWGFDNFSEKFTESYVFQELLRRGYVNYRYGRDNALGVRYEPWHIKV